MTREQTVSLTYRQEVHFGTCKTYVGPRGGTTSKMEVWRVNGAVRLWKTRPEDFQVPIKYGFNGPYEYITPRNVDGFHLSSQCTPQVINAEVR